MKHFILFILLVASGSVANAECDVRHLTMKLNPNSAAECAPLNLEGAYTIEICEIYGGPPYYSRAMLTAADGNRRSLLMLGTKWTSRYDYLDKTTDVYDVEILEINDALTTFHFSKFKQTRAGDYLDQLQCVGTLN